MSEQKPGKTNWLKGALGIVVVIAVVVGYKYYNRSAQSSEVRQAIETWIVQAPGYAENKAVFDELLNEAHEVAFKQAYSMGGRRRSATFDADRYTNVLFSTMTSRAKERGLSEIARSIRVVQANYGASPGK